MATNDTTALAQRLRAELQQDKARHERELATINNVLRSLDGLTGTRARTTGPRTAAGAPEEIARLNAPERVLYVMRTSGDRTWTLDELLDATYLENRNALRNRLKDLTDSGELVKTDDQHWRLATTPEAIADDTADNA